MKKGINVWSFRAGTSVSDCMSLAAKAGFDGIELALDEEGPVSLQSDPRQMTEIRSMASDLGLELPSLATGLYWKYSLTDNDPRVRAKAQDIVKKQLELAAALGARVILVVPGLVQGQADGGNGAVPYDVAYARAGEALRDLRADAESAGVIIGLENVWNKFLLSPLEMRNLIAITAHMSVRISTLATRLSQATLSSGSKYSAVASRWSISRTIGGTLVGLPDLSTSWRVMWTSLR